MSDEVAGSPLYVVQSLDAVDRRLPAFGAATAYVLVAERQCPAVSTTRGARTAPEQGMNPSEVTMTASG